MQLSIGEVVIRHATPVGHHHQHTHHLLSLLHLHIAQSVSAMDFNFERAVGGSILTAGFQRLPPARGGTAQKKIIHLANWSQLIHPGPASSLTKFFLVSSKSCVNADSLLIRAAATSTSGTLNDLTTDLIMANNNNNILTAVKS